MHSNYGTIVLSNESVVAVAVIPPLMLLREDTSDTFTQVTLLTFSSSVSLSLMCVSSLLSRGRFETDCVFPPVLFLFICDALWILRRDNVARILHWMSFRDNPALFSLLLPLVVSPNHGRAHTGLSSRWVVFFWERTWPPYLNQLLDATCVVSKSPYVAIGPPWLWWGRLLGGSWAHGQPFMTPQVLSPKGPGLAVVISGHRYCNYAEAQKLQRKRIGARKLLQRNKFPARNQWTNVKDYWNQIHINIQISGLQDNHSMNERVFNCLYFGRRWTELVHCRSAWWTLLWTRSFWRLWTPLSHFFHNEFGVKAAAGCWCGLKGQQQSSNWQWGNGQYSEGCPSMLI